MLVLSRKKGERILIGDDIEILVVEIRSNRVRLGFEAPSDVGIYRDQVYRKDVSALPVKASRRRTLGDPEKEMVGTLKKHGAAPKGN